ncbi:hypothetical protein F0U44_10570 [Nocardioides humilatus]|uniref:Transglycosylase SLT domain-containing protein n=2 Tax=Nocardioides humilatus TaxID=2607660 RepID=A0A5B1LE47_9ACTN|nr:hypothetical protein F0U44_10570 [Nocardioides humilatus]
MALAAYQRAEAVLKGADESCHLSWTLIAAVGQVVTQHGAQNGGTFDDDGVLHPKLKGDPITGDDGKKLPDSDAGQVDGDELYDLPVGPMQLAPPTWAIVGVDSDGDGSRNPYDIDDASLAVAVLLCSGEDDLSKRPGRVAGVTRVNDDPSFIESVLAADRAYTVQLNDALNASPTVIPTDPFTDIPTDLTDMPSDTDTPSDTPSNAPGTDGTGTPTWTPSPSDTDSSTPTETPSDTPSSTPSGTPSGTPSDTPSDSPSFSPSDTPSRSDTPSASATDPSTT